MCLPELRKGVSASGGHPYNSSPEIVYPAIDLPNSSLAIIIF
jgi:hypothetical protein